MMFKISLKLFLIAFVLICSSACSTYKSRFSGHKDDAHVTATQNKYLMIPKNFDMKKRDTKYDIPIIYADNNIIPKILEVPPNL